jgi:hypothetical protein
MASDLPHTPSTPEQLFIKAEEITHNFWVKLRREQRAAPALRWRATRKEYGARIALTFHSVDHCHCSNRSCTDTHRYRASEHLVRIKRDSDLIFLTAWLSSLRKAWVRKDQNSSTDSDD